MEYLAFFLLIVALLIIHSSLIMRLKKITASLEKSINNSIEQSVKKTEVLIQVDDLMRLHFLMSEFNCPKIGEKLSLAGLGENTLYGKIEVEENIDDLIFNVDDIVWVRFFDATPTVLIFVSLLEGKRI